jgi:hypothetical protein
MRSMNWEGEIKSSFSWKIVHWPASFRLIAYIQSTTGAAPLDLASFPAAAKLQQLLNTPQNQLEQSAQNLSSNS